MSKRVNGFHDARKDADYVVTYLAHLARSFEHTGNQKMADELFDLADYLKKSIKGMEAEFDGLIHDAYRDSQAAFYAPLKAIVERMEKKHE